MNEESNFEINIRESSFTLDDVFNKISIPNGLKNDLQKTNIVMIPKFVDDEPFFEIITQDLFAFLKENETDDFKVNICITEDDFKYIRTEAEEIFLSLGLFLLEELVLRTLIKRIKEFIKRKRAKKSEFIDLKLNIKRTKRTKNIEIDYKGSIDNLDIIFDKLKEI